MDYVSTLSGGAMEVEVERKKINLHHKAHEDVS